MNTPSQQQSQSQPASSPLAAKRPVPSADDVLLPEYSTDAFYDELVEPDGRARPDARALLDLINHLPTGELLRRQQSIEQSLYRMGITFTVYSDQQGTEKIMPFDIVPRIVNAMTWQHIEVGLKQRIHALNLFLDDIYNDQHILRDGIIPEELIQSAGTLLPACRGLKPPRGVWSHISGTDLVRDGQGAMLVLEDNLRCPSGVSYVLQNRMVMKRNFPQVFKASCVRPVNHYADKMYKMLCTMSPRQDEPPVVVVLTPGVFNSAYYEHSFLAQQMGVELVEGRDLLVDDKDRLMMRTTRGLQQVDVIYRRIDDIFMDPEAFREDSLLGVPGLMRAYRAGNVALANAPGTGIADDKVIYAYVPDIVRYYLKEDIRLPNVETYVCVREQDRQHVLANLDKLVVKAANESGGYGMLIGPASTKAEQQEFAEAIKKNPRNYIAQPTLDLSRVPTMIDGKLEGRHVDLRPYILSSAPDDVWVLPGGLTRVALKKGSLVVNSSQGGGSKDTWVVAQPGDQTASLRD
ncbi:circularly permuted type 2 ATP-grasp protein [Roseimaritima ulvae]|uniref:Circularly permuted ATP-grasp type 2 domain-containing protein n=1 Tax=Roseimaritima ulvae TaxID=980254 RepID=A0A5B9QUD1_9BACT|nr:circularly permuted type 2 ATP-grasp protein [Roseimaritima ulvae]QEG42648.1 hypothetical protein UC8_46900 [Roseimaritima ulvae]